MYFNIKSSRLFHSVMLRIRGLTAPVFTPLDPDGELDLHRISSYAQNLNSQQVRNIFVGGTSSEFSSFSLLERKKINEEWIKQGKKHLSGHVIVHVGATALCDAKELARHAVNLGADAIACVPPYYLTPPTLSSMVAFFKELTQTVPSTPFLYYHIPMLTHCKISLVDFLDAAVKEIPTFIGLKFTDESMKLLEEIQTQFGSQLQIFNGFDYLNLDAMKIGVKEGVGATFNFMPGPHHRMRQAMDEGNLQKAEEESIFIHDFFKILNKHASSGLTGALKSVSRVAGLDVGGTRLPLECFPEEEFEVIKRDLEAIDFFDKQY